MKAWLWQFITGYVKINIEGLKLLKFVNDAASQGILLRSAERESYSRITAEVSWRDYRRLLALSRNRPLRVAAVTRGGLPYIGALALKRLGFTIGLLLCIAALIFVNRFVLDIKVTGCTIPGLEQKVYAVLDGQGLRPGTAKWTLDLHGCERELVLELNEISFAAIRVNGVVATVNIVEGAPAPKILDKNLPCNVVARRDAIIRKVVVYDGDAKVTAGDAVKGGQMLVAGDMMLLEGFKRVHARADVMASIWYEGRGSVPLFTEKKLRTGAFVENSRLEFAGYVLPVKQQGPPEYPYYDTEEQTYYLLGQGLKGPRLIVTRYYEAYGIFEEADFEKAKQEALLQAVNQANALVPQGAGILDSRTDYGFTDGAIVARIYIETLENIAVEQPIQ